MMTALLWKVFGVHLWVSHLFIALWAFILAYQTYRLVKLLFPADVAGFILLVLLFDSTVLTQISIASPDIILLTALVASLRYIMEGKKRSLAVSLLFLVLINGRGMFMGAFVFLFYLYHLFVVKAERLSLGAVIQALLPFVPAFVMIVAYLGYYLTVRGWFFSDPDSPWASGWLPPEGMAGIAKNVAAYLLRLAENGRIFIYATGLFVIFRLWKTGKLKENLTSSNGALLLLVVLLFGLFLYFAFFTRIVIGSRYYMGLFMIFTLFAFRVLSSLFRARVVKGLAVISLLFLVTGHFWIYPDKISKAWDATLAHWSWYELRADCLEYMLDNQYDFSEVSGGFCLAGNQRYIDLKDRDLYISNNTDNKYFIYSNISNLDDEFVDELHSSERWREVKAFEKGFVKIVIYNRKD